MGGGGVYELLMVADVGGGGVKIGQKSADVIYGRQLNGTIFPHIAILDFFLV